MPAVWANFGLLKTSKHRPAINYQSLAEVLLLLLLFILGCVLTAGMKFVRMADNKPKDDVWDNI